MQERDHNGIMIGVNPFREWGKIYQKLDPYKFWTGDFKGFDGNMLQQAETAACEELRKRYRGNLRRFDFAIAELLYSVVAVNDDVYMSTHGMSSGHFLTALLNSLINKMYKAMWYYRYTKVIKTPSVNKYFHDVIDLVYGDDTIMAVKTPSLEGVLNAVTMTAFCQSIGLDFTDSNKKPFEKPFQNWEEVTFLKRSFTVHPILNEIVGPLAISTIYSSISWIDKKKDSDIVMRDKINVCQRELFLHYELYERDINHLALVCDRKGILFEKLPERVLVDLYKTGDYEYREDLYGIKQNID